MPTPTDEYLATLTENTRQYIRKLEAEVERRRAIIQAQADVIDWWDDESEMSQHGEDELPEVLRGLLRHLESLKRLGDGKAKSPCRPDETDMMNTPSPDSGGCLQCRDHGTVSKLLAKLEQRVYVLEKTK